MPIPKPRANESREKFVMRCITDPVMESEYPDKKQRIAVCSNQLKKTK